MKTTTQLNLIVATVTVLTAISAQAFFDPHTGRFASRDPIGERGGKNLYALVANAAVNRVDRLGLDAAVINHGGYTGHTSFVVIKSDGSVRAYHFYAKSHQTGRCCGLGSLLSVCCDTVSVWSETASSLQSYLQSQSNLGGPVTIAAYAYGTSLDDQLSIDELNEQDKADAGIYSLALGIECHKKSWEWFNEYLEGGPEIYPTIVSEESQLPTPEKLYESRRHKQEAEEQFRPAPESEPSR